MVGWMDDALLDGLLDSYMDGWMNWMDELFEFKD